jgi:hypothetical protein
MDFYLENDVKNESNPFYKVKNDLSNLIATGDLPVATLKAIR